MDPKCPWYSTEELADFCEADLCSLVVEPGNTWSNLGFILLGVWIFRDATHRKRFFLRWIGVVAILTGLGSGAFHATGMSWAGKLDMLALYLGTGLMTALNIHRWLKWSRIPLMIAFLVISFGLSIGAFFGPLAARLVYAFGAPCCLIEVRLFFRDRKKTRYRNFLLAWLFIGLGFLAWWIDLAGIWCDPNNHILSGHAVWHLLTAIAFYFFYQFYIQFVPIINRH